MVYDGAGRLTVEDRDQLAVANHLEERGACEPPYRSRSSILAGLRALAYQRSQCAYCSCGLRPRFSDGDGLSGAGWPTGITPTGMTSSGMPSRVRNASRSCKPAKPAAKPSSTAAINN